MPDSGDSIAVEIAQRAMKSSRRKSAKRSRGSIINTIRRPLAPPGHPMNHAKPDEKARPAGRKAKHKRRPEQAEIGE